MTIDQALEAAYERGWIEAACWAKRDDLCADVGSPAYLNDRTPHLDAVRAELDQQEPVAEVIVRGKRAWLNFEKFKGLGKGKHPIYAWPVQSQVEIECLKETVKKYQGLLHQWEAVEAARISREEREKRLAPFLAPGAVFRNYDETPEEAAQFEMKPADPERTERLQKALNDRPFVAYTPDMDAVRREELKKAVKTLAKFSGKIQPEAPFDGMDKPWSDDDVSRLRVVMKHIFAKDCNCPDQTDCTGECCKKEQA